MNRDAHKKVGVVLVPKPWADEEQRNGKTHFTDDEIHDIVELGETLRRIRIRLTAQGKWPDKKHGK